MNKLVKNLIGKRFGKLVVVEAIRRNDTIRKIYWNCICDCGKQKVISARCLGRNTNSCGCIKSPKQEIYMEMIKSKIMNTIEIDENECWIWKGSRTSTGYGKAFWKEKSHPAHRISWKVFKGEIPKPMFVCHKCDVPLCCNPEHLFLGTHSDNMKDMYVKGRGCDTDEKGRFVKKEKSYV